MNGLTRIQRNALRLCIKMAERGEIITDKSFGFLWTDGRDVTIEGRRNTGRRMLGIFLEAGYLIKEKMDGRSNYYRLNIALSETN